MSLAKSKKYHHQPGYTLGELFFVIFVLIATVSISVSLWRSARAEAHRFTSLSDVIQIQNALETYFKLEKSYPDAWLPDMPLIALGSGKIIMDRMPINQAWFGEKPCSDSTVAYSYAPVSGGYTIRYCINGKTEQHSKKRLGIVMPKAKTSATVTCPVTSCSGESIYYNKTLQGCTSTPSSLVNDPVAASSTCDICSDYGDLCSGGYLFCKPGDSGCEGKFIVAALDDLSDIYNWSDAASACKNYQSSGFADWSLPNMASSTTATSSSEMCQLMRSSDQCKQQTVADKCSGGCLFADKQKLIKLTGSKYWSALEASLDAAWLQYSRQARTGYDDKLNSHSVRCIKRL